MIDGCLDWQKRGLAPPEAVTAATDAYMEAQDAIGTWIEEACESDPQAKEKVGDLYASWKAWADRSGEFAGSMKMFSQKLIDRSEEHTSELQSLRHLVCRLLL